ncbi:hypothetical protein BABINDRAFT_67921 [Babjeviella inositovora NRRL Y-12698]|uniref:Zinc-ribbon 15 domain-containing protein n=1 Tax=Babjeviella inositovora NRRL Y-12698 TaxID=984486 RepID=A0A1E3QI05_9ASCO|nr:uncharacterized protein BABINDRAFT_67921 [Babjeviella inositovora NRRL Y-12698]ODQ77074.1 hypothetical protein BABINDRAFT_67921 [Babjeviella inositovora NRRL Y-12698]
MFFFVGVQDINRSLSSAGGAREYCAHCHNNNSMQAIRHVKCFSVFFIPIIPIYWDKRLKCDICNYLVKIDNEQVQELCKKNHL